MSDEENVPEELIKEWIGIYGHVFYFDHLGQTYIFRRLTRREYRLVLGLEDECERSEQTCETCTLWPLEYKNDPDAPAGVVEALCAEILRASGCSDIRTAYEQAVQSIDTDIEGQMQAVIEYAFPSGQPFTRFEDWSNDDLFTSYAKAKWALANIQGVQIQGAEEEEKKPRRRSLGDRADEVLSRVGERDPFENPFPNDDVGAIPKEFHTDKMAMRSISEVSKRYEKTQQMVALRQAAAKQSQ